MSLFEEEEVQRRRHNVKFCEGWLQHKTHRQHGGSSWEKLWLVLKGNIIYIFNSTDTIAENQVGNLTIDTESKFAVRGGDKEKGFKFDLTTGKRLNTFKTEKNAQRELWRAYVTGLSKGQVPSDIDLLDSEVRKIQREIDSYISGNLVTNSEHDLVYRRSEISKSSSEESGVGLSIGPKDGFSVARVPSYTGSGSSGSRSTGTFVDNGGPTVKLDFGKFCTVRLPRYKTRTVQVHKFYDDRSREQTPPSWFFSNCSRQQAETILQNAANYGNTLMRESTSYKDNGSYVISKLVWKQGVVTFEHYEVMRTVGGYKVNVENPHDAMRSLSQVMDYFVRTSGGPEHTKPLETNDQTWVGLNNPDYDRHIAIGKQAGEPWVWPPADYEEPESPTVSPRSPGKSTLPQHSKSFGPADSRNIAGILKTTKTGNSGKTVGFNSNEPHTVAASRFTRQKDIPSMHELVNRHQEAAELQNLDNIIGGFESDLLYVNEEEIKKLHKNEPTRQRQSSGNAAPPPPLPQPHNLQQQRQSYVNVPNPEQLESKVVIDSLPVAPPAPREPIPATATVRPIPPLPAKKPHRVESNTPTKSPPTSPLSHNQPSGHTKLHISHSFSPNSSNRPVASVQPTTPGSQNRNFRQSHSEEQFKSANQQIGSPTAFPSWRDNLKPVLQKSENVKDTNEDESNNSLTGVDIRKPGGVNTLRSKFERVSTGDSSSVLRNTMSFDDGYAEATSISNDVEDILRGGGGKIKPRRALSSILPMSAVDDEMYEILPEETETSARKWSISSNTQSRTGFYLPSSPIQISTNTSKFSFKGFHPAKKPPFEDLCEQYYDATTADDVYDDTVSPGDEVLYKADTRKVQFQVTESEPSQGSRLTQRRQTEPCVSVSAKEFKELQDRHVIGLNPDFKNKLEGLIGGVNPGPAGAGPKSPTSLRPTSGGEDHIYAELPPIEPDEVFYVNTKYNKET